MHPPTLLLQSPSIEGLDNLWLIDKPIFCLLILAKKLAFESGAAVPHVSAVMTR
jgi:hypothetical protein